MGSAERKARKIIKKAVKAAGGKRGLGGRLHYSGEAAVRKEKKKGK